jgi:hypothetical protein
MQHLSGYQLWVNSNGLVNIRNGAYGTLGEKVVFVVSLFIKHPFEVVSWHYVDRFPPYLPKVTVEVKAIASRFFRKSLIAKYVGTV